MKKNEIYTWSTAAGDKIIFRHWKTMEDGIHPISAIFSGNDYNKVKVNKTYLNEHFNLPGYFLMEIILEGEGSKATDIEKKILIEAEDEGGFYFCHESQKLKIKRHPYFEDLVNDMISNENILKGMNGGGRMTEIIDFEL